MEYPDQLYKYISSKYLESTVSRGELLFRNFTYFRQQEDRTRGDYLEAIHRDNPDRKMTIRNLTQGFTRDYDASFLNSTDSDHIFMFCTSINFSNDLYKEFKCDACIEITNPKEFCRRVRRKVRSHISTHRRGLLCGMVNYYKPNQPTEKNIKDATELPFLKDEIYSNQKEFRLVFGNKKAFVLKQQIVLNHLYNFRDEAMNRTALNKTIKIGSIEDITWIHHVA